jgi:NhaA family Na+:H+ antiporter
VILAFAIPHKPSDASRVSLLRKAANRLPFARNGSVLRRGSLLRHIEHGLHPWVAFGVLPIFAFSNAGVPLGGVTLSALLEPLPLGIVLGLALGKLVGVYGASTMLVRLGFAKMPAGAGELPLLGAALLCGVGFTMSLFIGSLAFGGSDSEYLKSVRLGVIAGSMLSGAIGYGLLRIATKRSPVHR